MIIDLTEEERAMLLTMTISIQVAGEKNLELLLGIIRKLKGPK